jgi:hypothetical protein
MAITTTTISINAGWARTDVITQLESAFTWLGFHGSTQTGIVTGISAYSGGGTVGSSNTAYYDVFPVTTTGIGTGASFQVDRSSGNVYQVLVNRPGVGYTNGEYVTLSPADIGGGSAVAIGITVLVAGGESPIGYGTTNAFYDRDVTAGGTYPWGVLRHTIQSNKKFGDTYRGFQMLSNTSLVFHVGSGFHPWDISNTENRRNGYANRFAGNQSFDVPYAPVLSNVYFDRTFTNNMVSYSQSFTSGETIASSTSYQLDLNVYRSGIDTRFAVLSYKHPTLSSTKLRENTYLTFILHNHTATIWDYDNVFLSGLTFIIPSTNDNAPLLDFRTYIAGETTSNAFSPSKRAAEFGYSGYDGSSMTQYKSTYYKSISYPQTTNVYEANIYVRNNATTSNRGSGGYNLQEYLSSSTNFNAVIKGIPINTQLIPCPYYIPDDFVLIDFDYGTPSANIQQGDTVTISGSEVYTVITGSYNQTTRTRGILFCARTV